MLSRFAPVLLALIFLTPSLVWANVCDDINTIANAWYEMGDAIHGADLDQLSDADIAEVDQAIMDAYDGTYAVAELMQQEGNDDEYQLGQDLAYSLDALWATQEGTIDDLVGAMDSVVITLDDITAYCDSIQ